LRRYSTSREGLFSIFALALGTAALVSAVGATQPTVTLIYILALSQFVPGILEDMNRRTPTLKFIACALIVLDVYLVA
jgi:hypothetical protein